VGPENSQVITGWWRFSERLASLQGDASVRPSGHIVDVPALQDYGPREEAPSDAYGAPMKRVRGGQRFVWALRHRGLGEIRKGHVCL